MAEVKVTESHSIGADEAVKRMASFEEMVSKFGVKIDWSGHHAKVKGLGVSGSIKVTDTDATVVFKLGMMARAAGVDPGRLEGSIRKRLKAAFEA